MTPQEADKIIAEYMGTEFNASETCIVSESHILRPLYSQSLDALVPVWEKLELIESESSFAGNIIHSLTVYSKPQDMTLVFNGFGETIQQAASIATARAVLALEGKDG